MINACHNACHGGLAGTGIAGKHHMQRHIRGGQIVLTAHFIDLHHVDEVMHFLLDLRKADIAVQLRQKIFNLLGRRHYFLCGFFFRLGSSSGRNIFLLVFRCRTGRTQHAFKGCAPKITAHFAQIVFRHGADHIQLLQDDFVFFIHYRSSLMGEFYMFHGAEQKCRDKAGQCTGQKRYRQQKGKIP